MKKDKYDLLKINEELGNITNFVSDLGLESLSDADILEALGMEHSDVMYIIDKLSDLYKKGEL